jgi:biopolymer transport protein ExbD
MNGKFFKNKSKIFNRKPNPQSDEMSLQITSMADIFIIIIVFLLKSFAGGAMNITPSAGMKLASAPLETENSVEALKVEISENTIQIEGKPVLKLNQFRLPSDEIDQNGDSKTITSELERERKRQMLIAQSNDEVKLDSKIIVIADQRVPYKTIKAVLASAAIHGFTDFKLAVVNENQ